MKAFEGMRIVGFRVCWSFADDKFVGVEKEKNTRKVFVEIRKKYDDLKIYVTDDTVIVGFGVAIIGDLLHRPKDAPELDSIDPHESWKSAYKFFVNNKNLVDDIKPYMHCSVITPYLELGHQPMATFFEDRVFVNYDAIRHLKTLRRK